MYCDFKTACRTVVTDGGLPQHLKVELKLQSNLSSDLRWNRSFKYTFTIQIKFSPNLDLRFDLKSLINISPQRSNHWKLS